MIRSSLPSSIDLKTDIDTKCGTIMADPTRIQQIMMNLCTNAAQAMGYEVGVLSVKLARCGISDQQLAGREGVSPGPFIELTISDTGTGIDRNTLKHIFEPYFTTKKYGQGTGLGLAMIDGIVKDYKGFIDVETSVGKGSSFHVYLPAIDETASPLNLEPPGEIQGGSERILIVDDEEAIVGLNKAGLQRLGYKVTGTTSSADAWKIFQDKPEDFDLILTDQTMPEITGLDLAKKILAIRPEIPIILSTGFSSTVSEKKAREAGISEFILKPSDRLTLAAVIRKVLDQ